VVDARAIGLGLARLSWVAVRAFLATLLMLTFAGFVLAGLSYYLLRSEPLYAAIAGLVAVVESIIVGSILGAKRALIMALAEGLRTLGLGRWAVHLVFAQLLGVLEGQHGERGGAFVQTLERLPLSQIERAFQQAMTDLIAAPGQGGWLRRKIRERLLRLVAKYTLARFRQEDAQHGGVDLLLLKTELEGGVDEILVAKVRGALLLWMLAALVGLPLIVIAQTYIVIALLH
jgi:hypothetical protein